ncbi:MAG: polysaccharide biosynthesis protein [Cyclobacteriaceae bacterium]
MKKQHNILITGGAGYLGSYISEMLLENDLVDSRLIIYSRDELKHFDLKLKIGGNPKVKFVIGDVRDFDRLKEAMKDVDIVIHAAAMKHVDICEANPSECIKTNIHGTENVIKAAQDGGVKKLIFISTDKAVEPVSIYGDTKQVGEKLVLKANSIELKTAVVRLGNLIGSTGSIVDKLQKMDEQGLFFVHDAEMTRFCDSLSNAWLLIKKSVEGDYEETILISKLKAINILDLTKSMTSNFIVRNENTSSEKKHEKLAADNEVNRLLENEYCFILPSSMLVRDVALEKYRSLPTSISQYRSDQVEVLNENEVVALLKKGLTKEV